MKRRTILLACLGAFSISACFTNYRQPSAQDRKATLHFKKDDVGSTFFNSVSDANCTNNQGRLATMDIARSRTQTAAVPAEKELFVIGHYINGFGTHCQPTSSAYSGKGALVATCHDQCVVLGSFVPQAGKNYSVDVDVVGAMCSIDISDLDAPDHRVRVNGHPVSDTCFKIF